jgi:hypothetical protein
MASLPPLAERLRVYRILTIDHEDFGPLLLQVIFFVLDEDGTAFILHARPLSGREKRRYPRHTR